MKQQQGFLEKLIADPKTTVTVLVGAAAQAIAVFGYDASGETQTAIITLTVLLLGLVARDTQKLPPDRQES